MLKGRLMQTVRSEAKSSLPVSTGITTTPSGIPYWLSAGIAALLLLTLTLYFAWDAHRLKQELRAANERNQRNEQMIASTQHQGAASQQELTAMQEQMAKM